MADRTPVLNVALIGNPNTGKSTLFNALSGFRALTGNYPGVTVEKKIGRMQCGGQAVNLIDLPGTYSLSPRTPDEMVTVDVLLGRQADVGKIDAVLCIVDASNVERNLYLASQVLDVGLPVVIVLNMVDVAKARGVALDEPALAQRLGCAVVRTEAHRRRGVDDVSRAMLEAVARGAAPRPNVFPAPFGEECRRLDARLVELGLRETPEYLLERMLLDAGGYLESHCTAELQALREHLEGARVRLERRGCPVPAIEARARYRWARMILDGIVSYPASRPVTFSDRLDRILTHKVWGLAVFAILMFLVFQAIYAWAAPLMDMCHAAQGWLGARAAFVVPPGPFQSLVVDGAIAGVGAVLVFLPQIAILYLFIALLEDCGYMARAAFLMDKLMTKIGLSGKSFVPLMSSFACAVPGIMATRVIENRRDRLTTILVAPLMSCSARQPVYLLMISAFIPATVLWDGWMTPSGRHYGISAAGIVLFCMTFLGLAVAVPVAWLLKKAIFRGETPPFVMELPGYKWPSPRLVFHRVFDRTQAFVQRAGTLIFATTIFVWAAGYFPGDHTEVDRLQSEIELASGAERDALQTQQNEARSRLLEQSLLGRLGHAIEPVVTPLGWDWRIGVGVLASFPAREVIIGTLGTIYSLGGTDDPEDAGLQAAVRSASWPDGRPVFNVPVALSIMVFFALCAQCASTLLVIHRETNSWRWPLFTFLYMTILAYAGAFVVYRIGMMFV